MLKRKIYFYNSNKASLCEFVPEENINTESLISYKIADGRIIAINNLGKYLEMDFEGNILEIVDLRDAGLEPLKSPTFELYLYDNYVISSNRRIRFFNTETLEENYLEIKPEAKTFCVLDDSFYVATYPGARIWKFPWPEVIDMKEVSTLDSEFYLGEIGHSQNRPLNSLCLEKSGYFLVSTRPEYGHYGGGLYVLDDEGNSHFYRDIVPKHTIVDIEVDPDYERFVYLSTQARGGNGTEVLDEGGHVVKWDLENEEIVFDMVPVENDPTVRKVVFCGGFLYSLNAKGNTLSKIDPFNGEILDQSDKSSVRDLVCTFKEELIGSSQNGLYKIEDALSFGEILADGFESVLHLGSLDNKLWFVNGFDLVSHELE